MGTVSTRLRGNLAFQPAAFLAHTGLGRTIVDLTKQQTIFSQGDAADAVFYIQKGKVKLTVISKRGKEATIALLGARNFLGEECIAAIQPQRMATATAITPATVLRIEGKEMVRCSTKKNYFLRFSSPICWPVTLASRKIWLIISLIPVKSAWPGPVAARSVR